MFLGPKAHTELTFGIKIGMTKRLLFLQIFNMKNFYISAIFSTFALSKYNNYEETPITKHAANETAYD